MTEEGNQYRLDWRILGGVAILMALLAPRGLWGLDIEVPDGTICGNVGIE